MLKKIDLSPFSNFVDCAGFGNDSDAREMSLQEEQLGLRCQSLDDEVRRLLAYSECPQWRLIKRNFDNDDSTTVVRHSGEGRNPVEIEFIIDWTPAFGLHGCRSYWKRRSSFPHAGATSVK